jgi:hypothetical protein
MRKTKRFAASLFATALMAFSVVAPAGAQVDQNGLVNVNVGDVNILNDANIGIAAQVAANICGVKVGPVAVLGTAVDRSGAMRTVCTTDQGPVTIRQT